MLLNVKKTKQNLLLSLFVLLSVKVIWCASLHSKNVGSLSPLHAVCRAGPVLEQLAPFWLLEQRLCSQVSSSIHHFHWWTERMFMGEVLGKGKDARAWNHWCQLGAAGCGEPVRFILRAGKLRRTTQG